MQFSIDLMSLKFVILWFDWRAKRPLWGGGWKTSYCRAGPYVIYIGMYVLYVHNLGVRGRFYGIDIKKEVIVFGGKPWRSLD